MRGPWSRLTLPVLTAGALVLAACGGATATETGRRIDVEVKEFTFSQPTITLKQGEKVTLSFTNAGTTDHEFMAGRIGAGGMGYVQDFFTGVKYQVAPPSSLHGKRHGMAQGGAWMRPGQTATISLVVPDRPGTYEFGCFATGHYEAGMKGTLTVE